MQWKVRMNKTMKCNATHQRSSISGDQLDPSCVQVTETQTIKDYNMH
jgi:hypothetical protein